jgi:hypothetical protein
MLSQLAFHPISLSFIILVFTVWHHVHFCGKDAVYGLDWQEGVDCNSGLGTRLSVPCIG